MFGIWDNCSGLNSILVVVNKDIVFCIFGGMYMGKCVYGC